MNVSAIRHSGVYPDLYLSSRKTMTLTIHAEREDIKSCNLIIFSRNSPEKKKSIEMKCQLRDGLLDHFVSEIHTSETLRYKKYCFYLIDKYGHGYYFNTYGIQKTFPENGFYEFLFANQTEIVTEPEGYNSQIYYQIFPERFKNGDLANDPEQCQKWGTIPTRENYMGGDLAGILLQADYLKELGIGCIYLNPIFHGDFNHKYATTNYFEIDSLFGNVEVFRELVQQLHKRNIKIILDGVFNHCGIHFAPFEDLIKNQENSQYRDWFYIKEFPVKVTEENPPYECVGDYAYMPKLNSSNPEVREYIIQVMLYWISNFGIDGWRLDVSDEVDESVWLIARRTIKEKFPNTLLLGETWGNGLRLMSGNQMDSIMNYVFRDAVVDFIAKGTINAYEFDSRINKMLSLYPHKVNLAMFLPLDSHDTERFLTVCKGNKDKMRIAVLFQLFFIGSPSIFYGDEVGIEGENDPDCRKCMIWNEKNQDRELLSYYKKLIGIRNKEESIKTGIFTVNLCERRVYGFIRSLPDSEIYIVINAGNEPVTIDVPVFHKGMYKELLNNTGYTTNDGKKKNYYNDDINRYEGVISLSLDVYDGKVIKRREKE